MKILKSFFPFILIFLFLFVFKGFVFANNGDQTMVGIVSKVVKNEENYQLLEVVVTKGELKNKLIYVENGGFDTANYQEFGVDDKLLVSQTQDLDGNNLYIISDYLRQDTLIFLFVLFAIISTVVTGIWGITSLLGMFFSFLIIFKILLPLIINGYNPVLSAVGSSMLIIPVTFYLSHGFNKKTHMAIAGTIVSLIITGLLATAFISQARLTGFSSEEAGFLLYGREGINMVGILLAGIIIGTLGVLDDVTVSQSAIVFQLKAANEKLKLNQLYFRAMKVGKDHIASMINTLVLVYAGASMPLLLLFVDSPRPIYEVVNYELIAEEIIRTLIGSIGLVSAIPITTTIAVFFAAGKINKAKS